MSFHTLLEQYLNSLLCCNDNDHQALIKDEIVRVNHLLHRINKTTILPRSNNAERPIQAHAIETISCVITNDSIKDVSLVGEITITLDKSKFYHANGDIYLKFNNMNPFEINTTALTPYLSEIPFVFKLNTNHSTATTENESLHIIKYTITDIPQVQCPILITPVWQFKPDETICMVNLRPLLPIEYTLLKVNISVHQNASDILSKPSGIYNKIKSLVQWDLPALEKDEVLILRYKNTNPTQKSAHHTLKDWKPYVSIDFTSPQLLSQISIEYGSSPSELSPLVINTLTMSENYKAV